MASMNEGKTAEERKFRDEYPTGWLVLTKNESIPYIIDALLDSQPHREFNQSELARAADVSRQSVGNHIDLLVSVGILETVDGTTPTRYRFDEQSAVSEAIIKLEGAMNRAEASVE